MFAAMPLRAVHVVISGIVQGVGYRVFVEREAERRELAGWVRNRRDGSVEAVFSGDDGKVDAMLDACRRGPPVGRVDDVAVAEYRGPALTRFTVLPTA
jgi:acylphosphatase